jgi:hypothetical protein
LYIANAVSKFSATKHASVQAAKTHFTPNNAPQDDSPQTIQLKNNPFQTVHHNPSKTMVHSKPVNENKAFQTMHSGIQTSHPKIRNPNKSPQSPNKSPFSLNQFTTNHPIKKHSQQTSQANTIYPKQFSSRTCSMQKTQIKPVLGKPLNCTAIHGKPLNSTQFIPTSSIQNSSLQPIQIQNVSGTPFNSGKCFPYHSTPFLNSPIQNFSRHPIHLKPLHGKPFNSKQFTPK